MKHILLIIAFLFSFNFVFAQPPTREYGEYKYDYSIDKNRNRIEATAFPRIRPMINTYYLGYSKQSMASYMYLEFSGTLWFNSAIYDWSGFHNGWYVYTFRMGDTYNYFLISQDYERVRILDYHQDGITHVYKHCNPNEKMDNAPTY